MIAKFTPCAACPSVLAPFVGELIMLALKWMASEKEWRPKHPSRWRALIKVEGHFLHCYERNKNEKRCR